VGIESDQLVFDYLSRVGDLAQQYQLPSATRMRLVSELRGEIDRRRSKAPVDNPAAVRRILARLGTPDEVVAAAGDGTPGAGGTRAGGTRPAVPVQRTGEAEDRPRGLRRVVPRPRRAAERDPADDARDVPSPPHLASTQELGDAGAQTDWWRVGNSPFGVGENVPGFVGGVEIPELLKPPAPRVPEAKEAAEDVAKQGKAVEAAPAAGETAVARRRRLPRVGGWSNPLLLLAAVLLVVGAALGNWIALGLGWIIAYTSRRLSPVESKWAVLGMPGVAVTAGIVWLWGRTNGRWGDPIADGHMKDAVGETWPWVVRGAAVASALYLVWRSRRPR